MLAKPNVQACAHTNVTSGAIYDYCEDCGAVRTRAKPGRPIGEWHSCDLCRLPGFK